MIKSLNWKTTQGLFYFIYIMLGLARCVVTFFALARSPIGAPVTSLAGPQHIFLFLFSRCNLRARPSGWRARFN